jgi:hypothetical protein
MGILIFGCATLKSSSRTFSTNAWSNYGATNVHLRYISEKHFRDLVEISWRKIAPKRLVAEHDAGKRK